MRVPTILQCIGNLAIAIGSTMMVCGGMYLACMLIDATVNRATRTAMLAAKFKRFLSYEYKLAVSASIKKYVADKEANILRNRKLITLLRDRFQGDK